MIRVEVVVFVILFRKFFFLLIRFDSCGVVLLLCSLCLYINGEIERHLNEMIVCVCVWLLCDCMREKKKAMCWKTKCHNKRMHGHLLNINLWCIVFLRNDCKNPLGVIYS